MQGEEMKDIAHDVVCKKKRYEVGGCEGDNATVGEGIFIRRILLCSTEPSLQDDTTQCK